MVSTWKLSTNRMQRTSVGLLNHPAKNINGEKIVALDFSQELAA